MATINKGFLGNFKGNLGYLKGSIIEGKPYINLIDDKPEFEYTFIQKTNQSKFGLVSSLASWFKRQIIDIMPYSVPRKMSKFQYWQRLNKSVYDLDLIFNPKELILSNGSLSYPKLIQIFMPVDSKLILIKYEDFNNVDALKLNATFYTYIYIVNSNSFEKITSIGYHNTLGFVYLTKEILVNTKLYFFQGYKINNTKTSTKTVRHFTANSTGIYHF